MTQTQVIGDINRGAQGKYGVIVKEIKARASSFTCVFSFDVRASNTDAHSLARFSLNLSVGCHVWLGQPHEAACIPRIVDYDE